MRVRRCSAHTTLLYTVLVGEAHSAAAVDEARGRVFVAYADMIDPAGSLIGPGSVSIHDAASGRKLHTVGVNWGPQALAVVGNGQLVVLNAQAGADNPGVATVTLIRY